MPRHRIELSLWDPLVIELGDKTYTSVPRSVRLTEDVKALDEKRVSGAVDLYTFLVQFLGLFFDVNPEEFRGMDRAILEAIGDAALEYVNPTKAKSEKETLDTMTVEKAVAPPAAPAVAPKKDEASAEKNVSKPGSVPTP